MLRQSDFLRDSAVNEIFRTYWYPIFAFLLSWSDSFHSLQLALQCRIWGEHRSPIAYVVDARCFKCGSGQLMPSHPSAVLCAYILIYDGAVVTATLSH